MATKTRKKKGSGDQHRTSGNKTVRSSSRIRAARAGSSDQVLPGKRNKKERSVIDADSDKEIYGVQMSERARKGESNPTMPESKVKTTQSKEPKKVPRTGVAKSRKAPR